MRTAVTDVQRDQRDRRDRPAAAQRIRSHEESKPVVLKMGQGEGTIKFYLDLANDIEQAPSIGPRTAQRLQAIGIRTVADFLSAEPAATAARLKRRSVDASLIRDWQQQAALVCRIPWLRGHDAQILVACGVTDPEALAKLDAATFWKIVQPFAESIEGKRILRSSKAPDLDEVTHWIQWASRARTLRGLRPAARRFRSPAASGRRRGERGSTAIQRLFGMLLTTVAVQMFLTGIQQFFALK